MRPLLLSILGLLTFCTNLAAQEAELLLHSPITPDKSVGLIVTGRGIVEKTGIKIEEPSEQLFKVSVPVEKSEFGVTSFATSMFIADDGELFFTPLKSLHSNTALTSRLSEPACSLKKIESKVLDEKIVTNLGAVQSLFEIRKVRREFMRLELSNLMKGDFLEKLKRLEEGFGLAEPTPLNSELNPYELSIRLFRIEAAINNYEANK